MRKRFDDIFSALMLAAAVAVVLAGFWVLSRSIARAEESAPAYEGQALIQPLEAASIEALEPAPAQEEAIPLYIYHPGIPLSAELQAALHSACAEAVPGHSGGADGIQRRVRHGEPGVCAGSDGGGGQMGRRRKIL